MKTDDKILRILGAHLKLIRTPLQSPEEARVQRRRDRLIKSLGTKGRQRLAAMGQALARLARQRA
jgi:hypothetical protein